MSYLGVMADEQQSRQDAPQNQVKLPFGCVPCNFAPMAPYDGSIKSTCRCGNEMWVGPKGQEALAQGLVWLVCLECVARKSIELDSEIAIFPMTNKKHKPCAQRQYKRTMHRKKK